MKTTSPTPKPGRKIVIDLKTVPVNYKAATRLFCQRFLSTALQMSSWNVTKCAKALGISRRTLQLKMRQLGIHDGRNAESSPNVIVAAELQMTIESESAAESFSLAASSRSQDAIE